MRVTQHDYTATFSDEHQTVEITGPDGMATPLEPSQVSHLVNELLLASYYHGWTHRIAPPNSMITGAVVTPSGMAFTSGDVPESGCLLIAFGEVNLLVRIPLEQMRSLGDALILMSETGEPRH
ncbi:MAG TPA: hypothetical protein VGH81_11005 [Rudaea sp.]|jgi:hypothetical protein